MPRKAVNIQNLRPKKKGETGNPNGRPKGVQNRQTVIRDILHCFFDGKNPFTKESGKYTVAQQMIFRQAINAIKDGDLKAVEFLFDGAYGKVTEKNEITLDADVKSESVKGKTRAELRAYAQEKYGLNPDALFLK